MSYIANEFSLYWLAASVLLLILFGLIKMGIAVSKMTMDANGTFNLVTRSEGLHLFGDKRAKLGVKYQTHKMDQATYASNLNKISYLVGIFALATFIIFVITLFLRTS